MPLLILSVARPINLTSLTDPSATYGVTCILPLDSTPDAYRAVPFDIVEPVEFLTLYTDSSPRCICFVDDSPRFNVPSTLSHPSNPVTGVIFAVVSN
jgi:hypothetical protein